MKRFLIPPLFLLFSYFIISNDNAKVIVAGIAIFLIGMHFMENGFKLFSGGTLEKILAKFTSSTPKSIATGFVSTSIVQSSSLTSIVMISFLSAGLIGLTQAIGVIFGSNLGSTTTAWIVAYFGFKVKISVYAMPMIIFGVVFKFATDSRYKGVGYILLGLGFIFLGISYMKEGFDALKNSIDLASYAIDGYVGILIFVLIGAIATVVIQSSAATMAIIITALAGGQILYISALALAIGANIGTTVTAIIGASTSNEEGKRLAAAHLIFNFITAFIALLFIYQLSTFVDLLSEFIGIDPNSYILKLALFHTVFNILGILLVSPFIGIMVNFLNKLFIPKVKKSSKPKFLNDAVIQVPETAIHALRKEVINLYDKSLKAVIHAMNLHREDIFSNKKLKDIVHTSNRKINTNIDEIYKETLKSLYSEIIRFSSLSQKHMTHEERTTVGSLKTASRKIVKSVKEIKELQKNINHFSQGKNSDIKYEYNLLREQLAYTLREIETLRKDEINEIDRLTKMETIKIKIDEFDAATNEKIDDLIRTNKIDARMATSLINDASFASHICVRLVEIANIMWIDDKEFQKIGEDNEY